MYHYKESGLRNVWLENGYTVYETAYGDGTAIDDVDGLHALLALRIAEKKGSLSATELRFLRVHLCLSQASLAKMLGVTDQSVSLWERKGRVPKSADKLMRILVLGTIDGNRKISEVLNRINTVERIVNQKIVAREMHKKWTATISNDEAALA